MEPESTYHSTWCGSTAATVLLESGRRKWAAVIAIIPGFGGRAAPELRSEQVRWLDRLIKTMRISGCAHLVPVGY
jgi:hypothetical protein